jgi:hypothetical protein
MTLDEREFELENVRFLARERDAINRIYYGLWIMFLGGFVLSLHVSIVSVLDCRIQSSGNWWDISQFFDAELCYTVSGRHKGKICLPGVERRALCQRCQRKNWTLWSASPLL